MKITDETVEQAVGYLASTDESHARARAAYNALSEMRKTVRAFCSSDVMDTALALQFKEASCLLSEDVRELMKVLRRQAFKYKRRR